MLRRSDELVVERERDVIGGCRRDQQTGEIESVRGEDRHVGWIRFGPKNGRTDGQRTLRHRTSDGA